MHTNQFQMPKWRNVAVFKAAAVALAIGAFASPAVSHAEKVWDIGQFDSCVKAAEDRFGSGKTDSATLADEIRFCCDRSGGEWTASQGCTAPPATFQTQPQTPHSVEAPRPTTATKH